MTWTTILDGIDFLIETNFADGVYTKQPSLIRVTDKNRIRSKITLNIASLNLSATYVMDVNYQAMIDCSDIFKPMGIGTSGQFELASATYSFADQFTYTIVGLVSPNEIFVPRFNSIWYTKSSVSDYLIQSFPSRWIMPQSNYPTDIVEVYTNSNVLASLPLEDELAIGRNNISIPNEYNALSIFNTNTNDRVTIQRQDMVCNKEYAVVEWVSRFGGRKRHVWEVASVKEKVSSVTELMTNDYSFRELKGEQTILTLRLDQLTQFDYWYYADIIASDDVRIWLCNQPISLATFDDGARVLVTSKSYTLPSSTNLGELNVEMIWKNYLQL